jgi:GT2 family glycosyltransferase
LNNPPKISVIVPHYNDLERLDVCLTALGRQFGVPDEFEIVVADNASPQGESAVAAAIDGRALLVTVTEKGAGPARNGGVAASRGEILAFTDSDCLPEPDWLAEGLKALADCDVVGGRVSVLVDDPAHMAAAEAYERVFAFDNEAYVTRKGFSGAGNLFCTRRVFDAVGGFRTGVSEDVDWSHRATAAGFRLGYASGASVGHPARRTWAELTAKWRRVTAETYGLSAGQAGRRGRWILRTLALPVSAVAHTPKVLMSRNLNTAGQRLSALVMLYRLRMWRCFYGLALLTSPAKH